MRTCILALSLILLFSITLVTSCTSDDNKRIDELEKQVALLSKQLEQQESEEALFFKVFEKDVEAEKQYVGYNANLRDNQFLTFPLLSGYRVEGEVAITGGSSGLVASVRDPYNNTLFQSATKERHISYNTLESGLRTDILLESVQEYPWKFSFVAASTGDYTLAVWGTGTVGAKLKVTIHKQ